MDKFLNFLRVIVIAIVEGITEWLPISSTGHMIIVGDLLGYENALGKEFWNLFLIIVQLAAIFAVLVTFFKTIWPFGKSKTKEQKTKTWWLILNIVIACLPAAVIGLILDDIIDDYLMNSLTVSITLIVYGLAFILIEYFFKKANKESTLDDIYSMSWKTALIIGAAQVLALIPGTSRSGVTILAAMLIGCSRSVSAEFSFLVAIPVMFGASGLKTFKAFAVDHIVLDGWQIGYLLVGCVVAFIVSILTIKYFMKFLKKYSFTAFGYYRIGLGVILLIYFIVTQTISEPSVSFNLFFNSNCIIDSIKSCYPILDKFN